MIHIVNLSKHFGEKKAVDDLSLEVAKGQIFGFLGPNGAGKTTTVKMLTGMIKPTSGYAEVAGFDVNNDSLEVKKRIGYVPESGALFESLTAWEYLEVISELHHMPRNQAEARITEFLSLFDLLDEKDTYISRFSKGMRQKVLLSAAFLHNPDVLFLDEPFSGLDVNSALLIKSLLKKMAAQGKTIMFCSHILEVVERICTRIAIINKGKIVTIGTPDEIVAETKQPSLEYAFNRLTNSPDVELSSEEFLQALDRA